MDDKWICTATATGYRGAGSGHGPLRDITVGPVLVTALDAPSAKAESGPRLRAKIDIELHSIQSWRIECVPASTVEHTAPIETAPLPTHKCEGVVIIAVDGAKDITVLRSGITFNADDGSALTPEDRGNKANDALYAAWKAQHPSPPHTIIRRAKARNGRLSGNTVVCGKYPFSDKRQAIVDAWPLATWTPTPIKDLVNGGAPIGPVALGWSPVAKEDSGDNHTCAGMISARTLLNGGDMTPPWVRWYMVKNVPGSSPSDAETTFRRRLHDHGRAKATQDGGVMQLIHDPNRGFVTSESYACWKGKPPSAPIGWPETVMSWKNEVLRHGFADWSDDDPVPTQRAPH
jgi:hypothetical protein